MAITDSTLADVFTRLWTLPAQFFAHQLPVSQSVAATWTKKIGCFTKTGQNGIQQSKGIFHQIKKRQNAMPFSTAQNPQIPFSMCLQDAVLAIGL
jgi:hypothetical protein